MPNKYEQKLNEASDLPGKNSVYDFLYHDAYRIGAFLSQLDPNGLLQSITNNTSTNQGEKSSSTGDIKTGLMPVVSSKVSETKSANSATEIGSARTYDPLWQNSLALLDYLQQGNLINKNILNSHIGQFVLISGNLFMLDMGIIQSLLTKTGLKQVTINNAAENGEENKAHTQLGMEIFCILPASIQAFLIGTNFSVWSTLQPEGLSLSTDDLHLKHGPSIAGNWNILGILDALPVNSTSSDISAYPEILQKFDEFFTMTRSQFGRPPNYFGITPLLVFRKVSGN